MDWKYALRMLKQRLRLFPLHKAHRMKFRQLSNEGKVRTTTEKDVNSYFIV